MSVVQLPLPTISRARTLTVDGDDLIPALYTYHRVKGRANIRDVTINLTSLPSSDFLDLWDSFLVSTRQDRITYLQRKYVPEVDRDGRATFPSGCLLYAAPGILQIRDISEWFRKLMSDVIFSSTWTGSPPLTIQIPTAQLRSEDLPIFSWFFSTFYNEYLHPRHLKHWKTIPSLEEVVRTKRSVSRRYYLRYYYAQGKISWDTYLFHRVKKWRQRRTDGGGKPVSFDPIWDTVEGWLSDPVEAPKGVVRAQNNPAIPRPMERPCYTHLFRNSE